MDPITIDFETDAIVGNPLVKPPRAVGAAFWIPGQEPFYLAWGHPTGNNCTFAAAHDYVKSVLSSGQPLLFHNAPFDVTVLKRTFCNARMPKWDQVHDTMYLLFLNDPHAKTYALKPSAEAILDLPPSEQDDLTDWILQNVSGATRKNAGAYISLAPVDLVEPYAIGDVVRTRKLFDYLYPKICELGMEKAYDRERKLMPILVEATQRGIRIDRHTLEWHEQVYTQCREMAAERLAASLGCPRPHIESDELLADALERSGAVTEWVYTEKSGKRSMSKDNLKIVIPEVKILMGYIGGLDTCLGTFMRPWLEKSAKDGRVHPNWNQVRQTKDARNNKGTRTGRLSSDEPNFQHVPTEFVDEFNTPMLVPEGLHPLPMMRRYCLPEEGHMWIKRDFSSQEIRILAHFEDGALAEAYRGDPNLDPHEMARRLIEGLIGVLFARKDIKITGFSMIYGTGYGGLASQLGRSYDEAVAIKTAYLTALPGVRDLQKDVQRIGKSGNPIRTWGGRIYFAEEPKIINGRYQDFAYKLLNYLIQGSAADQTKEAINDWNDSRHWWHLFLATVHDEINTSAPEEYVVEAMRELREAMDADRFDVPMRSEGYIGKNWHDMEKVNDLVTQ